MSNNLNLDQVGENQALKETTINTAIGQIDAGLTETKSLSVGSGNITISATDYRRNNLITVTNATTAGRTVTLPDIKRQMTIASDVANTQTISVVHGSSNITVAPGDNVTLYNDGTANSLVQVSGSSSGATGKPYDIGTSIVGLPDNGEALVYYTFVRNVDFAASLAGSNSEARVAATAQSDFDVLKNGSSIGTIRFAAAGTIATYVGIAATSFAPGDVLSITAPSPQDTTLADIAITFAGSRP